MLTDAALRALKPKEKDYKVADRDGMYVHVTAKGAMSFRMDYRLNGRRERLYLGKYAPDGLFLARSREKCIDARRAVAQGISPAIEKQREKRRLKEAKSFGELGEKWLQAAPRWPIAPGRCAAPFLNASSFQRGATASSRRSAQMISERIALASSIEARRQPRYTCGTS